MYFAHVKTLDQLKAEYRRLAMIHHPDRGGSTEDMQAINAEYDATFRRLSASAAASDPNQATPETPEEFRAIIDALLRLDGLVIELCGSWLWIGGNTYKHKSSLKALGLRYSAQKKLWYWSHDYAAHNYRGTASMQDIRDKYGAIRFRSERGIRYSAELNA